MQHLTNRASEIAGWIRCLRKILNARDQPAINFGFYQWAIVNSIQNVLLDGGLAFWLSPG